MFIPSLPEKCPNTESIQSECEYSVRMQEDTGQKNFVFEHFTQVHFIIEVTFPGFGKKSQTNLGLFVKCC